VDIRNTTFKMFLESNKDNPFSQKMLRQHHAKIDWRGEADQEMDPAETPNEREFSNNAQAPYYVGWSGQSHEWYGDGPPSQGEGRYKQKGDGGKVVAINVPDYATAKSIADKLDSEYHAKNFSDDSVYNQWGEDYYLVDYHGAYVQSMSKMDGYHKEVVPEWVRRGQTKDYAK
jgi:hypothetical protein